MAMKHCPVCGEKYSDTYKRCPFCVEKQRISKGKRVQRRRVKNGSRVAGTDRENVLTLVLLVILLILAGILLWLLFGGGSESGGQTGGSSSAIQSGDVSGDVSGGGAGSSSAGSGAGSSAGSSSAGGSSAGTDDPVGSGGSSMPEVDPPPTADEIKNLPKTLSLSSEDYTTSVGDVDVTLRVRNGSGTYTWVSANPAVATVDSTGKVTAVGGGNTTVYVTDGVGMGSCIVRVKGSSAGGNAGGSTGGTGSSAASNAKLSNEDMTLSVGELWPLKVRNYEGEVTWSVADPSIASILSDGTVKALKVGRTTVTAKVGDSTLKCIVRVKN